MRIAFLVVEARGQALHLREDANFNLMQAAHLAAVLLDRGVEVRVRLVIDGGQSIEEYSLLYHLEEHRDAWRRDVALAADRRAARRELVTRLRDLLPFEFVVEPTAAEVVAEELFYAPLLARLGHRGPREAVFERLAACAAPAIDLARWAELEELAASFAGQPYLELEAELARRTIARRSGCSDIRCLAPAGDTPADWVGGDFAGLIADDLATHESPRPVADARNLASRLVGLFPAVPEPLTGRLYFNSPTSCRVDHGRVRLVARDRFDLLAFEGVQKCSFEALRERLSRAAAGAAEWIAPKYPLVPRAVAADLAREVHGLLAGEVLRAQRGRDVEAAVVFLEGITGLVNPQTGGRLFQELRAVLPPEVVLHRFAARRDRRDRIPNLPGALPLVEDAIAAEGAALFDPPLAPNFDPFVGAGISGALTVPG